MHVLALSHMLMHTYLFSHADVDEHTCTHSIRNSEWQCLLVYNFRAQNSLQW